MSCNVVLSYHIWLFLILFVKQVRVRARVEHDEDELCVVLLPDEQPVGLDVALPLAAAVTVKNVRLIFCWKFALSGKDADGSLQFLHVITAPIT